jgi:hypothetical protein
VTNVQIRRQFNHGYRVFGDAVKHFPGLVKHLKKHPEEKACLTNHKIKPSIKMQCLVEKGLRKCAKDPQSLMGKNAMASAEYWGMVYSWKKRQCFVGMADSILGIQTSYQRWTNFLWNDVLRLMAYLRVFVMHFLPNSNGQASSKFKIKDPKQWSKLKDSPVKVKKVVKKRVDKTPQTLPSAQNFIISLISDDEDEAAAAKAPVASASFSTKKKRGLYNDCFVSFENVCFGIVKTCVCVVTKTGFCVF